MNPMNTTNPVDAITHDEKRAVIPTTELAGEESLSAASAPAHGTYINSVVNRGQDPELFWLGKYTAEEEGRGPAGPFLVEVKDGKSQASDGTHGAHRPDTSD